MPICFIASSAASSIDAADFAATASHFIPPSLYPWRAVVSTVFFEAQLDPLPTGLLLTMSGGVADELDNDSNHLFRLRYEEKTEEKEEPQSRSARQGCRRRGVESRKALLFLLLFWCPHHASANVEVVIEVSRRLSVAPSKVYGDRGIFMAVKAVVMA